MNVTHTGEKHIYVRAEGNSQIGYGHLMRSLAFAVHASKLSKVSLMIREPDSYAIDASEKYGFELIDLSSTNSENEAAELLKLVKSKSLIFIDGYNFNEDYLKTLADSDSYLIAMDDHHDRQFPSGCVINIAELDSPEKVIRDIDTRLVFGLKYALVRPDFKQFQIAKDEKTSVFICFGGGGETVPLIHKAIQAISQSKYRRYTLEVVLHQSLKENLSQWLNEHFNNLKVNLYSNLDAVQMNLMMNSAIFGVSSSSTVSLECRAAALPLIAGYFVDNQIGIYNSLVKNDEILGLGNLNKTSVEEILAKVESIESFSSNSHIFSSGIQEGIYQRLINLCFTELDFALRPAQESDMQLYLDWVNMPQVRNNAINPEPIKKENHEKWFYSRVNSATTKMWVGTLNGKPVGQIRFDLVDGSWEIDYSVIPESQGKGLGEMLVRHGMKELHGLIQKTCVIKGLVKQSNNSSIRVFRKLHFEEQHRLEERNGLELHAFTFRIGA